MPKREGKRDFSFLFPLKRTRKITKQGKDKPKKSLLFKRKDNLDFFISENAGDFLLCLLQKDCVNRVKYRKSGQKYLTEKEIIVKIIG